MSLHPTTSGSVTDLVLNHPQVKPWQPLLVFALFALTILLAGNLVFQRYEEKFKKDRQNELSGIAQLKIDQIGNWVDERKDDARALKDDPLFLAEVDRWLQRGAPRGAVSALLTERLASMQQAAGLSYTDITLMDSNTALRLTTSNKRLMFHEDEQAQVLESMSSGDVILTDIHRTNEGEKSVLEIDLIAPLFVSRNGKRQLIGAIMLHMDPQRFLFPLIQHWPTASASAETLLVRRDGDDILFLNTLRHRRNTELDMRMPLDPQLPATKAILGKEGFVEGVDYRGEPVIGVVNKVPGTTWFMVSKIDLDEVNAPIDSLGVWIAFMMLGLTGMGGGVIAMWWRKQRQHIQSLKEHYALELERQALSQHLDHLSRYANDIILLMDTAGRVIDFNDRTLKAYGYPANEFENIELSRLRADPTAPQTSILLDNLDKVGAQRFDCMHVRKNGEEFPVEFSVRAVELAGEKYYQAIIRDITERKKAEESLQRLNRSLKLLVECNSALVRIPEEDSLLAAICKLIVETGGYRMAWVGFAGNAPEYRVLPAARYGHNDGYLESLNISWADNEYGRGPTGTSIRNGSTQVNQDVVSNSAMLPWRDTALAHDFRASIALPLRCEGDTIGALSIYADKPNAFSADEITLLEELADNLAYGIMALRVAAERALAESHFENERTRLRTLVQSIPDLVWLKDEDGVYLFCNRRFELFFGASEADIVGKTDYSFVDRELADFFRMHDRRAMNADQPTINEEWLTFAATGYHGLFETIKTPMRDSQGQLTGVLGVAHDITDRINAEKSIRELNADLDATLKAIPDLLFELDEAGRYINIWARNPNLLFARKDILLGHTVDEMLPPDSARTVMAALRAADEQGYSHGQVIRLNLPQGEFWFELSTSVKTTSNISGKRYIMLSRDITEQKLSARSLASSYVQLQRLTLHMENVRADERAKIARNLHDEMGATLAAMKMRIAWLASRLPASAPQLTNESTQISELVSDGIQIMHQIVTQLRPYHMEDVELVEAIRHYVQKFRQHTNIECKLNLDELNFTLDTDRSLAVFRILQESLNNVVTHAQASRVNITFTRRDGSLLMAVKDNGKGFDTSQRKELSFGLLGIRERALMVGGKARIVSTPGKGTRVSVSIPCSAPQQNKPEAPDA